MAPVADFPRFSSFLTAGGFSGEPGFAYRTMGGCNGFTREWDRYGGGVVG